MNKQGKAWAGEFGDQYTKRNKIDWQEHLPLWREVLEEFGPPNPYLTALEVGCNRGHNLKALYFLWANSVGIDINKSALNIAKTNGCNVQYGDALSIPFGDNSFDLTFTMGVLIHIAPKNLSTAIREMYRVSKKFVLSIEYPADEEEVVNYHGNNDMLWKRDFQSEFISTCPSLQFIRHWQWGTETNPFYDRVGGWLFKKEK